MPNTPANVRRGAGVPGLDNRTYIHVIWDPPVPIAGNHVPLLTYELTIQAYDKRLAQHVTLKTEANGGDASAGNGYLVAQFGLNNQGDPAKLTPGQQLWFSVAACNVVGCSNHSAPPAELATAPSPEPFPWLWVAIPLGALLLCVASTWLLCWCTDLPKVIAPKLRRKKPDVRDPLADFVEHDFMPMEDQDPEIVMNPVLLAKMEAMRKSRGKGEKGKGTGRSGGLKRLGLQLGDNRKEEERRRDRNLADVDKLLNAQGVDTQRGVASTKEAGAGKSRKMDKLARAVGARGSQEVAQQELASTAARTRQKQGSQPMQLVGAGMASDAAASGGGPMVSKKQSKKFSEVL